MKYWADDSQVYCDNKPIALRLPSVTDFAWNQFCVKLTGEPAGPFFEIVADDPECWARLEAHMKPHENRNANQSVPTRGASATILGHPKFKK